MSSPSPSNNLLQGSDQGLKASEVLERAAARVTPEGAWTQEAFARTKRGHPIGYDTTPAVCFCTLGALYRETVGAPDAPIFAARRYLSSIVGSDVADWNDTPGRTQAEVVDALKRAAELARSEGA